MMDIMSMSNAEIDAALKALGPIGVWAADWIAKKERALSVAQDQVMINGALAQRLRQKLEACKTYPPLLVDSETGKVTSLFDVTTMQSELVRLRGVCEMARLAICEKDYDYAYLILNAIPSPGAAGEPTLEGR